MSKSLKKSLDILEIIANSKEPCGVTEIANLIGQDKSTVHRILNTFKNEGYVDQIVETKKYILGLKFLELSDKLQKKMDIVKLARKVLEDLSESTGESVHLGVTRGIKVIYIDRVAGKEIVGIHTSIGDSEPLYCTATGKAILAFLSPQKLEDILDQIRKNGFKKFTNNTINSKHDLLIELNKIRAKGIAYDDEELYKGVKCIAVPIINHNNMVVASIGVSGPAVRMNTSRKKELSEKMLEAGKKISKSIGNIT